MKKLLLAALLLASLASCQKDKIATPANCGTIESVGNGFYLTTFTDCRYVVNLTVKWGDGTRSQIQKDGNASGYEAGQEYCR